MSFVPLQTENIYAGHAFSVERILMQLPNGKTRFYDLVRHAGAITIVPLDADGNILFVRQYRLGAAAELLELPAGVLNEGEDPAEAAAREIREETGMAAAKLIHLGNFYLAPGYSSEFMHVYLATGLSSSPLEQNDDEFLQVVSLPAAEALQRAHNGQIPDGKTLAALFLAEPYLSS